MQNIMKIWLAGASSLLVMMLALFPFPVEAGKYRDRGPSVEGMLCRLEARLKLTPEQKEKLRPLLEEEMERMREMKTEHRREMAKMREKFMSEMEKQRDGMERRLARILTDEQKAELKEMRAERRKERDAWQERAGRRDFHGPRGCW